MSCIIIEYICFVQFGSALPGSAPLRFALLSFALLSFARFSLVPFCPVPFSSVLSCYFQKLHIKDEG